MATLLDHFKEMLGYDQWANELSLLSIESIPVERREGAAYQRLLALIPHNLIARRVWRARILGEPFTKPESWFPPMTPVETRAMAVEIDQAWHEFLSTLTDADLDRPISFRTSDGTAYQEILRVLLTHVFNHATYHRGQIARLVTEHGGTRAATDYFLAFQGRQG